MYRVTTNLALNFIRRRNLIEQPSLQLLRRSESSVSGLDELTGRETSGQSEEFVAQRQWITMDPCVGAAGNRHCDPLVCG
jgi:hypothetical protein